MRSTTPDTEPQDELTPEPPVGARGTEASDDRTARARIRDAAIAQFSEYGVAATTVRRIAAAAHVSPGLVIHHFGSKQQLRIACDEHVAAFVREAKQAAMSAGLALDPLAAMRAQSENALMLRYLARTLAEGSPQVAVLVDEMVRDATEYMEEGVRTGILRPSDHPFERAAVLTVWSLGALVLHEHMERLLGADLTADPSKATGYLRGATDVLVRGVITEQMAARLAQALPDDVSHGEETGP
jgi:AcrR family transcriptional regulator